MAFEKGHPKFGGKKKGTKNKQTRLLEHLAVQAADQGVTPLELMLTQMRHYWGKGIKDPKCDMDKALELARAAAPFMHPRFQAIGLGQTTPEAARALAAVVPKKDAVGISCQFTEAIDAQRVQAEGEGGCEAEPGVA